MTDVSVGEGLGLGLGAGAGLGVGAGILETVIALPVLSAGEDPSPGFQFRAAAML